MKLVIQTQPTFFVEEDKILTALFEAGLESLHLYKPNTDPLFAERLLMLIKSDWHKRITLLNHFYLAHEYHVAGIQLADINGAKPNGYKGHVNYVCDRPEQIPMLRKMAKVVVLDHVFDGLKGGTDSPSLAELYDARRRGYIDKHVYARGGVSAATIPIAHHLGFGGVVVTDELWQHFDIHHHTSYQPLLDLFGQLKEACH